MAGYCVAVAYRGPQALELAWTHQPHAILTELALPQMGGYRLAAELRGESDVVLIAITSYCREGDRERARQAGFQHFFVKPANPDDLLEVLAGLPSPVVYAPARILPNAGFGTTAGLFP